MSTSEHPSTEEHKDNPEPEPSLGFEPSAFSPTLGDRMRDIGADPRAAVVVLAVVVLVAGVLWYRSGSGPADTSNSTSDGASSGESATTTSSLENAGSADADSLTTEPADDSTDPIVVHVAGAVSNPGVVRIPAGSRVGDAVDSAGGALGDADLDRLNLAAVLEDGQRILVARRGDPIDVLGGAPGVTGGSGEKPGHGAGGGNSDADPDGPINLNEADTEDLEKLPGIGPVLAEAIIDERESRGGFQSVNELRDVRGIGEKRFADLRDRVTV